MRIKEYALLYVYLALHANLVFGTTDNKIITIAGNATAVFPGDGGPATSAGLLTPFGIAVDGSGNVYIADTGNNRIRVINSTGGISSIAGIGVQSFSGDGGPATSAGLKLPTGVAVSSRGLVYVADTGNNRIRVINSTGVITTFAGNGNSGFSGDGGPAFNASLSTPYEVWLDKNGNVLIADAGNNRIRMVNNAGIISTVAGVGISGNSGDGGPATIALLTSPKGVAVDNSGKIVIADTLNARMRLIRTDGVITPLSGTGISGVSSGDGGPAVSAVQSYPDGVAVDGSENVYFSDTSNNRIRVINSTGGISTIAGVGTQGYSGDNGPASLSQLANPTGVAVDGSGNIYICDYANNLIRKVIIGGLTIGSNITVPLNPNVNNSVAGQPISNAGSITNIDYNIPPGAVSSNDFFSVSVDNNPPPPSSGAQTFGVGLNFKLGTGGSSFNNSVGFSLTVDLNAINNLLAGRSSSLVKIAFYNSVRWVILPDSYLSGNKVYFNTNLLGKYSLVIADPSANTMDVKVYPNPFNPNSGSIVFDGLTSNSTVKIYDVSGALVKSLDNGTSSNPGNGIAKWDGRNEDGDQIAAGLYICNIYDNAGNKFTGKIGVKR